MFFITDTRIKVCVYVLIWEFELSIILFVFHFHAEADVTIPSTCPSTLTAAGIALLLVPISMAIPLVIIFVLYETHWIWKIRYWLYVAKESYRQRRGRGAGTSVPTEEHLYIYDAFVAYSSNGEERSWVHTTLREKLEDEHGLKLCMYHRDFRVGRDLADAIIDGIYSSRKTLIILSPDFLNSGWCEFEARIANEKAIIERQDSLFMVIFKPLYQPGTKLSKILTRLMEKKIYIEWTDDPDGQRLFWRRLVNSIESDPNYPLYTHNVLMKPTEKPGSQKTDPKGQDCDRIELKSAKYPFPSKSIVLASDGRKQSHYL